jgi:hypothetical protein
MRPLARILHLVNVHLVTVLPRVLGFLAFHHEAPEHFLVEESSHNISQEGRVGLHVIDDINLVEEDARVEHIECRIVNGACENDVLEKLQPVGVMYFLLDAFIADRYGLVVTGRLVKELAIIGFVRRELWVVYSRELEESY